MQLEAEAERLKRKEIILSEATKIGNVMVAEGKREADLLKAKAKADAIKTIAEAEKEGLSYISTTLAQHQENGSAALNYILKKNYYKTYKNILSEANVTVVPDSDSNGVPGNGNQSSDLLAAVSLMMSARNSDGIAVPQ